MVSGAIISRAIFIYFSYFGNGVLISLTKKNTVIGSGPCDDIIISMRLRCHVFR